MSHRIFPTILTTCLHTKKTELKLLLLFLDEILSLKNKSCAIEKIPAPALRFAYYCHSYNNYVKIVSTSTYQTKLKKTMIKQTHVIRIIFHVNEEPLPRPSFQESIRLIYVKKTCSNSSYSCKEFKDLHTFQYFPATLKLLTYHVHETWFSKQTFKRTRWFLTIRKIFDILSRLKIREMYQAT